MVTIKIKRSKVLNKGASGQRQGPAWNYCYTVEFPEVLPELGSVCSNQGTSLKVAEIWASRFCTRKYGTACFSLIRTWE